MILKKTKAYLCGPLQYDDGRPWREDMQKFLNSLDIQVFNPFDSPFLNSPEENEEVHKVLAEKQKSGDHQYVHEYFKKIRRFDLAQVDAATFIVCHYNPNVHTVGTLEELFVANSQRKPIFIHMEGGVEKTPYWLAGVFKPKHFYNTFDEMKNMLAAINSGEVEIDSDRWRLLKPEFR